MKIRIYQVDAFVTGSSFSGNPAAVCPLDSWIPDGLMQNIAAENNLAETAFFVKEGDGYHIRWFTPAVEVDLCGHATLAAAHVLFHHENHSGDRIIFSSRSGELRVTRQGELLTLDFPSDPPVSIAAPEVLTEGLRKAPLEVLKGKTDFVAVFGTEEEVLALEPDFRTLARAGGRGVIATAPGKSSDFVSRFFAPQCGIDEDPVTGSAYTTLSPFWAERLSRHEFDALQLSRRKGLLHCRLKGSRVEISGRSTTYLQGEITV
jgi:PhzF family phenazine biosynthesis protein